jgi:hypothetical protein
MPHVLVMVVGVVALLLQCDVAAGKWEQMSIAKSLADHSETQWLQLAITT